MSFATAWKDAMAGLVRMNNDDLMDTGAMEDDPVIPNDQEKDPSDDIPIYEEKWDFGEYLNGLLASTGEIIDRNQRFNAEEAQKARDWQVQYMKDYYPNLVQSLKSAGLNPILAAGIHSAASVPAAASASSNNVGGDTLGSILAVFGSTISDILSSAIESLKPIRKIGF